MSSLVLCSKANAVRHVKFNSIHYAYEMAMLCENMFVICKNPIYQQECLSVYVCLRVCTHAVQFAETTRSQQQLLERRHSNLDVSRSVGSN